MHDDLAGCEILKRDNTTAQINNAINDQHLFHTCIRSKMRAQPLLTYIGIEHSFMQVPLRHDACDDMLRDAADVLD